MGLNAEELNVGDSYSEVIVEDLTRTQIVQYAGASGDYNPVHSDEKFVTERAYDNPKFVEDMVRDIAVHFSKDDRVTEYIVESENFESIHNHSAYAQIHKIKE